MPRKKKSLLDEVSIFNSGEGLGLMSHLLAPGELEIEIEIPPTAFLSQHLLASKRARLSGVDARVDARSPRQPNLQGMSEVIYLAGGVGGILQGIDIIALWLRAKRKRQEDIHIRIRTAKGQVDLEADTIEEARALISKLKDAAKPP